MSKSDIYESAITAGLDPSVVFTSSASGFEDTVTPLINSIGLVIYGQDEESNATVKFRAEGDTYWREALDLAWEPIYGSFAGLGQHGARPPDGGGWTALPPVLLRVCHDDPAGAGRGPGPWLYLF